MKIQLETITSQVNRSFSTMLNPRLSDLFFWHFHPEYELVYINNATGTRQVGEHISTYIDHDLVLIGSNIPHLNFDYGVQSDYKKAVIHFKKTFIETTLATTPELSPINQLFKKSAFGIAFNSQQTIIGEQLFELAQLSPLQQYLQLLSILESLSKITDITLLHEQPYDWEYSDKEQNRLRSIHAYIDQHYQEKIELQAIAAVGNLSKEAFCRYFKKTTKYTFTQFLNRYRISQSKRLLMAGKSVSEACFTVGFESLSYYNRIFKKIVSENPSAFRKRYLREGK